MLVHARAEVTCWWKCARCCVEGTAHPTALFSPNNLRKVPMNIHRRLSVAVLLGAAVAAAGCSDSNQSGMVRASTLGARADIAAPRIAPGQLEVQQACGADDKRGAESELIRYPYLQQVSASSAQVLWATASGDGHTVEVTTPRGEPVGSFASRIDEGGAVGGGGYQHLAELTGLQPAVLYCYAITGPRGELLSRTGFRTAPESGALAFVAFGDSGHGGADQKAVTAQLETVPADLMLITGDIAYDSGTLEQFEEHFFAMYEPLLASLPVFPTSGNHDYETSDASPYRAVFSLPDDGEPSGRERWYSFDWGDAHFVALDTEKVGDEQAAWLDQNLARNHKPWTIVYAHRGPYSSGSHGGSSAFRQLFSPILEAHGVQLVLSGHDHNYERTVPIGGVTHVVTGGGGRGTRGVGSSEFTAFSLDVLHFVYVTIDGPDLRLYAIDATGQEFDFAHIVNEGWVARAE
jgi:acid phosphatase type 7